jgi:uncharacterized protein
MAEGLIMELTRRVLDTPLVRSPRLRPFVHEGRDYAHLSAVPLVYLSANPTLTAWLQGFSRPQRPRDRIGARPSQAEARFFLLLHRVGVLLNAQALDTVHDFRGHQGLLGTLLLYPTSSCNLRCVYCHAESGAQMGPHLDAGRALAAVNHFFTRLDAKVRAVTLAFHGGGEPTLQADVMASTWRAFRRQAEQRGLVASARTITNGVFGPAALRLLQDPAWHVAFSYDGPRQRAQRPTPSHEDSRARVIDNLRALQAVGKAVSMRATLTRDGLSALPSLVEEAAELGIRRVQVEPASLVGRGAHLSDGPPEPLAFTEAFLEGFHHGLRLGVQLTTSAWSHARVGAGRYCGAIQGTRALTPDGFLSACTEVGDGRDPDDPFLVGRQLADGAMQVWPAREAALQRRVGYALPICQSCFMVDTCAGGCASRARAQSGDPQARDIAHCRMSQAINARLMADLADGRLLPDLGWQPMTAALDPANAALPGCGGRLVALVPPFARPRWNADAERRPAFPVDQEAPCFFHLPP